MQRARLRLRLRPGVLWMGVVPGNVDSGHEMANEMLTMKREASEPAGQGVSRQFWLVYRCQRKRLLHAAPVEFEVSHRSAPQALDRRTSSRAHLLAQLAGGAEHGEKPLCCE